jgi:hypothetical protein
MTQVLDDSNHPKRSEDSLVRLERVTLDKLRIEDEKSYRHIGLYDALKRALLRDKVRFWVPKAGAGHARWDRVLFLNLTFWTPSEAGDVLEKKSIPADVLMHAAWHHVTRRALLEKTSADAVPTCEALFLGEAIASAFDMYLVGRLLGHAPNAAFLETQVPAMSEAAEQAGMDADDFEALLDSVAKDPERAFEDLRQLLFDACMSLVHQRSIGDAADVIAKFDGHRFGALLHHYELSTWILYARAYGQRTDARDTHVQQIDDALRQAPVAIDWLERHWLNDLSEDE